MQDFMTFPEVLMEKIGKEDLILLRGGNMNVPPPNNSNGICQGTNNADGRCGGANNGSGICGPV